MAQLARPVQQVRSVWLGQPELLVRLAWQGPKARKGQMELAGWRELQESPLGLEGSEREILEALGWWAHRRQRRARRSRVSTRREAARKRCGRTVRRGRDDAGCRGKPSRAGRGECRRGRWRREA